MYGNMPQPPGNGSGRSRFPLSRRTLGILVMIAGAAAFFYSQVNYTDQLLCLGGSTLLVFAGLAIIVSGRRSIVRGTGPQQPQEQEAPPEPAPVFQRRMPRGLRQEARRRTQIPPPAPSTSETRSVEPHFPKPPDVKDEIAPGVQDALLDHVIAILDEQGAQVVIETQRNDTEGSRGILQVQSADGLPYRFLVLEGSDPVDVADVRALFALITSSGSAGGYLVASAPFTQRAYDWAGARHIHLVQEDELSELSI